LLTSRKFKLYFRGGKEFIVSEQKKQYISNLFDRYFEEEKDTILKLPDGSSLRISNLLEIAPVESDDATTSTMRDNMARLKENILHSTQGNKNGRIRWWCERMKENFARLEKHQPWQHYTKEGKPCTAEEARISIFS